MTESNERPSAAIALITTPGLVEALIEFHRRDGHASVAQLAAAGIRDPLATLRTLGADGHVTGPGSFDQPLSDVATYSLTYSGRGLAGSLRELLDLGRPPAAPPTVIRGPRRWLRRRLSRLGLFTRAGRRAETATP